MHLFVSGANESVYVYATNMCTLSTHKPTLDTQAATNRSTQRDTTAAIAALLAIVRSRNALRRTIAKPQSQRASVRPRQGVEAANSCRRPLKPKETTPQSTRASVVVRWAECVVYKATVLLLRLLLLIMQIFPYITSQGKTKEKFYCVMSYCDRKEPTSANQHHITHTTQPRVDIPHVQYCVHITCTLSGVYPFIYVFLQLI